MEENFLQNKSMFFSIRMVELYQKLSNEKHEYVMSKQALRSGTSIGANIREAKRAQSTPDFYSKLTVSLKEADETQYWLELLNKTGYINDDAFKSINSDCDELIRLLVSITRTVRNKMAKNKYSKKTLNSEIRTPN
ncbi:four helix bundle protein [Fibrobacter sp. UWB1]|uniref:four helix bundle protein n=1 Tax=Fibrobacter sp. UWB1 TaxID=1964355 RepID=UPI000B522670|nr:four helix bundle protein [Fibrobacter sp. UWB1]OWV25756.1 four helix bundle protein [Fibrobacter sp. UWB1]